MKLKCLLFLLSIWSCASKDNMIKIKGSDTEVNLAVLLAEQFHVEHTNLLVSVSGGGSGLGIASLLNGNTNIANSSRSMKEEEVSLFHKDNIELDSFIFAQDAIAFVVSEKLPIDSINLSDLTHILNGTYTNWNALIQRDLPITIYGRQSNSGTHEYIKNMLGIHFSLYAKQMNGNAQILEAIKADNSGIGYVSVGYVLNGNIKGVKILTIYQNGSNAISPLDADKIASGAYFFQRPLFQFFRKSDFSKVKPFLDFEKSAKGAAIIQTCGYYPVNK